MSKLNRDCAGRSGIWQLHTLAPAFQERTRSSRPMRVGLGEQSQLVFLIQDWPATEAAFHCQSATSCFRKRILVFTPPQSVHSNLWSERSRRAGCCSIRASFIGLRHLGQVSFAKRSKDMVRFLCEHLAGSARATVELFAGENLGNAVPLAEPLGSMNSRQKG